MGVFITPPTAAVVTTKDECEISIGTDVNGFTNNTLKLIPLDTIDFDNNNLADIANNRIVIKNTGHYLLMAQVAANGANVGSNKGVEVQLLVNGSQMDTASKLYDFSAYPAIRITGIIPLNANDVLTMWGLQNNGLDLVFHQFNPDRSGCALYVRQL